MTNVPKMFFVPNGSTGSLGQFIWTIVLEELEDDIALGEGLLEWLRNAEVSLSDKRLEIRVWTRFQKEVVTRRCMPRIKPILTQILPDVEIIVIAADHWQQTTL